MKAFLHARRIHTLQRSPLSERGEPKDEGLVAEHGTYLPWGLLLALGLVLSMGPAAQAGTTISVADNDVAGLIAAINNANSEVSPYDGADTIELAANGTYTLTTAASTDPDLGDNGLPVITSTITINGNGATIQRDPALFTDPTDSCSGSGAKFRIVRVDTGRDLTLDDVTVRYGCANRTPGFATQGGAIFSLSGTVTLTNSTVAHNTADQGGGIENNGAATLTLTNSTVAQNTASSGGGIRNKGGTVTLTNSTVAQNTARNDGGGIYNDEGTVTLTNSTVAQNTASGEGGGIYNNDGIGTLTNTLLAQNTALSGANCFDVHEPLTSQGHNLATDTSCDLTATGDQQDVADPGLGPFTDLGLPGTGHFPLLPTSPAIDMGDDTKCLATDQLDQPRVDIPAVGMSICDIGAIEFVPFSFTGFFAPVDNFPTLNVVKAGQGIPVKFSLGDNQGLDIFESGYPVSQQIVCDSTDPQDSIEVTVSAGNSSLSYDPSTDQYTYIWKTSKAWANTCRQLILLLSDGTQHMANFHFTR